MNKRVAPIVSLILLLMPTFAQRPDRADDSRDQQMPMPEKKPDGQSQDASKMSGHEGMPMPGMNHGMQMNLAGMFLMNMATGTSMNPQSWRMPMFMPRVGSWNL